MKYRRKPEIVEAVQWWHERDYPQSENWGWPDNEICPACLYSRDRHGRLRYDYLCPGDWIVHVDNSVKIYPKNLFNAQFEPEVE